MRLALLLALALSLLPGCAVHAGSGWTRSLSSPVSDRGGYPVKMMIPGHASCVLECEA